VFERRFISMAVSCSSSRFSASIGSGCVWGSSGAGVADDVDRWRLLTIEAAYLADPARFLLVADSVR